MNYNCILVFLFVFLFYSCNSSTNNEARIDYVDLERVFSEMSTAHQTDGTTTTGFRHFIYVKNYSDNIFQNQNFTLITKRYLDTCASNKGLIADIYFLKSVKDCGFESNELNYPIIHNNSFLGFKIKNGKLDGVVVFNGTSSKVFYYSSEGFVENQQ